uniref:Small ribosomal subunit protein uS15 N-terminal domain-containing protein n=1 Tax=Microcebus murinus TaxID=30608 RepID=A0A8C6EIJ3_MICMU
MGRMHAPGKGLSQSALPYRPSVPTWLKLTSDDVKEQIYKLAKKGLTPSQIGSECHGVSLAHSNLKLLGSSDPPASQGLCTHVAWDYRHPPTCQLIFFISTSSGH